MIFTMNSQDLLEGLNTVTRALSARSPKQILEGILISAEDNRVKMTCSDGSLVIECTNAASIQEEGQTVLPGKLFTELIRKMPVGNADEYPEIQGLETGSTVKIPQNRLRDMISRVVFAIATDESRQILTGSLLEVSRSEARLVALDGFRLAMQKLFQPFELPEGVEVVRAIIPGKVLNELSRILPDDDAFCTMLFDRNRMQCTFGNIRLTSGLLAGEYIDYRRILPSDFKTEARANRISVQDAIDRASLMAREGKNNLIKMSFHDDILKITSNAELGDVEEEMDASLNGDPIDIAFNARYITDVIRNVSDDNLCMKFNSNISPCVVVPESGDDFVYLILPVRVFQ